jgi:hypothetical protein
MKSDETTDNTRLQYTRSTAPRSLPLVISVGVAWSLLVAISVTHSIWIVGNAAVSNPAFILYPERWGPTLIGWAVVYIIFTMGTIYLLRRR